MAGTFIKEEVYDKVEQELVQLLYKIDLLDDYISFGDHKGVGARQVELMKEQLKYMRLYAGVLEERLL